jgi:hypothetical protein
MPILIDISEDDFTPGTPPDRSRISVSAWFDSFPPVRMAGEFGPLIADETPRMVRLHQRFLSPRRAGRWRSKAGKGFFW